MEIVAFFRVGEIGFLEVDDVFNAFEVTDGGVSAVIDVRIAASVAGSARIRDGRNATEEGDENRELDKECQDGAHGFDVVAFIEVHHLERFHLAVSFTTLFYFSEFGLDFAHEAGLVELALHEGPHTDFYDYREQDNRQTEISDEVVDYE